MTPATEPKDSKCSWSTNDCLQDPPAGSKQKINHDRRPALRMKSADSKSSMTQKWSQNPKDWGEPALSQIRQECFPKPTSRPSAWLCFLVVREIKLGTKQASSWLMVWHCQSKVGSPELNQSGLVDQAVEAGSAIKKSAAGSASIGESTYVHFCLSLPPSLSCCASHWAHAWILLQSWPHLYYRLLVLLNINSTKNTQKPAIKHRKKSPLPRIISKSGSMSLQL